MYVGTQVAARNDADFEQWAQLGVVNICSDPPGNPHDWTLEDLKRHREKVNSYGIELDMVQIPLSSTVLNNSQSPHIMQGISPERDREIESIQNIIRMCGEVGIPAVKYNMNIIGIPRSEREEGRGGASASTFRWAKMNPDDPPTIAGEVSVDEFWERIDYFLERAVPAAEDAKVRMACHPHDPYTPDGYMGVTRVLGTVDGLKKFIQMHESPYHGLNFCQGTVTEMLDDPGAEIADVIRWFGSREKIFNVHFRNIRGHKLDFMETFPDEGSIDFSEIIKVYQEVGYKYMLMPDHVPWISGDDPQGTAFAFCYGYITALLQMIDEPRKQPYVIKQPGTHPTARLQQR
ncbi:MAG: mannonate dehydratase [Chloroflexi bacterium]|nr:mannonate dehydratase [Chloroflexota bacterium]MBO03729.1 mannonate dehydratase [Chloroflexota bacterium]HCI86614.1 mannonate dehydratase [Dehalococcoidia bacterium]|tara:strand:- start:11972 stop:13012 length:1041 start_codon:yes stop_codon:yes gene_type:complete